MCEHRIFFFFPLNWKCLIDCDRWHLLVATSFQWQSGGKAPPRATTFWCASGWECLSFYPLKLLLFSDLPGFAFSCSLLFFLLSWSLSDQILKIESSQITCDRFFLNGFVSPGSQWALGIFTALLCVLSAEQASKGGLPVVGHADVGWCWLATQSLLRHLCHRPLPRLQQDRQARYCRELKRSQGLHFPWTDDGLSRSRGLLQTSLCSTSLASSQQAQRLDIDSSAFLSKKRNATVGVAGNNASFSQTHRKFSKSEIFSVAL